MSHTTAVVLSAFVHSAYSPTWPSTAFASLPLPQFKDLEWGGPGRIAGTVKFIGDPTNTPTRRRVVLLRERDGVCIGERWSDAATGAYSFDYIDPALRYTVAAYDYEGAFRIVLADNLTPTIP